MGRPLRLKFEGAIYHVMLRGTPVRIFFWMKLLGQSTDVPPTLSKSEVAGRAYSFPVTRILPVARPEVIQIAD